MGVPAEGEALLHWALAELEPSGSSRCCCCWDEQRWRGSAVGTEDPGHVPVRPRVLVKVQSGPEGGKEAQGRALVSEFVRIRIQWAWEANGLGSHTHLPLPVPHASQGSL